MLLFQKQDENNNIIQLSETHYNELKSVNDRLQKELSQLNEERNDITQNLEKLQKKCDEYKRFQSELENQNNALKQEVGKLQHVIEANKARQMQKNQNWMDYTTKKVN